MYYFIAMKSFSAIYIYSYTNNTQPCMYHQLFSLYSKAERTAGSRIIRLNRDIDCANAAE